MLGNHLLRGGASLTAGHPFALLQHKTLLSSVEPGVGKTRDCGAIHLVVQKFFAKLQSRVENASRHED